MPDHFSIYRDETAPVDGSEGQFKKLFNAGPADLFYRSDPGVSSSDAKLKPGKSKVIRDRVWITTPSQTEVIVEAADDGVGGV